MTQLNRQNLHSWLDAISSVLGKVSAVEIQTTIVDQITDEVFIPYEVYQALYLISPSYLAELKIQEDLRDRYLRLRRQLELQYALLLIDKNSSLYSQQLAAQVKEDLPLLTQDNTPWNNLPCRLPPPVSFDRTEDDQTVYRLLAEPSFRSMLRQLGTAKAALDRLNSQSTTSTDANCQITYAQTVFQLDGKLVNRYASEILEHSQQPAIVKLHQEGVAAGIKQWYKLLQFMTQVVGQSRSTSAAPKLQNLPQHSSLNDSGI